MREIPLTHGKVALVSDEDYERVMQYQWYAKYDHHADCWTAAHVLRKQTLYMHRFILNAPPSVLVDHWDHDTLNNQRENIRICTPVENQANRRIGTNNTTGYKGVCWDPKLKKFRTRLEFHGKKVSLGIHETAESAALAYNNAAKELFGEFALTNQLPGENAS